MRKVTCIALGCVILFLFSCTNDKTETDPCAGVSYVQTIRPLVNLKCAISGCHVAGFQPGDFTKYEVLKQKAKDGKIELMVFNLNIMPPASGLNSQETSLLRCWVNNGAPE